MQIELSSQQIMDELAKCWNINDMVNRFGVTAMTIHNWRNYRALPAIVIDGEKRPAVRFVPHEVIQWAKDNDVRMIAAHGNPAPSPPRGDNYYKEWSEQEDRIIISGKRRGESNMQIADKLPGRTHDAVHGRAHRLGLTGN